MASGLFPALDPASLTSELCANPKAAGVPGTSTFKANCMQILGTAVNPSQDVVLNTDVYGSVKAGGGGGITGNKHSTDVASTDRFRASSPVRARALTLKVIHASTSDFCSSACSHFIICPASRTRPTRTC